MFRKIALCIIISIALCSCSSQIPKSAAKQETQEKTKITDYETLKELYLNKWISATYDRSNLVFNDDGTGYWEENKKKNKFSYELKGDNLRFFFEDGSQTEYQMELKHAQAGLFMFLNDKGETVYKFVRSY